MKFLDGMIDIIGDNSSANWGQLGGSLGAVWRQLGQNLIAIWFTLEHIQAFF
jgi:hypothetical protein